MGSQEVFWAAGGGIVMVFLLIATVRKRQPLPSRLHLKGDPVRDLGGQAHMDSATRQLQEEVYSERSLNVLFMYNGHSWDAYEVLGVPAGARHEQVEAAYRHALNTCQPQSREFFEAAYVAITQKH